MIRAETGLKLGDSTYVQEYENLKAFWGISPIIEDLLGDQIHQFVTS
jgi:hypothetical protein